MNDENPSTPIRRLPAWKYDTGTLCGSGGPPLVVLLNQEYAKLSAKLAWMRAHCVSAALTTHHDYVEYAKQTDVPFAHISFAAEPRLFDGSSDASTRCSHNCSYAHDIGFSGTLRPDQTGNIRDVIWRLGFPQLRRRAGLVWRLRICPPRRLFQAGQSERIRCSHAR